MRAISRSETLVSSSLRMSLETDRLEGNLGRRGKSVLGEFYLLSNMAVSASNWEKIAPNGTNLVLFKISLQYILALR